MSEMIEVNKHDANNYCLVLRALGMEEEGDPVAEIERLGAELQQAREERTALLVNEQNLREELAALRASLDKPIEQLEAMPMREKEELVIGWFSEDWAISKGLDMLHDYEKLRGMK